MAMFKAQKCQEGGYDNPSRDETGRFPVDALIRAHGYRVLERKPRRQPVWVDRSGIRFGEQDLLRRLPPHEVRDAMAAEMDYFRRAGAA